jgi:protein TonB
MTKLLLSITLAVAVTFGLFAFMASLISSDSVNVTPPLPPIVVEIVKIPEDSKIRVIKPVKLQPPEPPTPMPKNIVTPTAADEIMNIGYQSEQVVLIGGPSSYKQYQGLNNNEARPIVRVNPKYPMNAMRKGTEGWVKLAFDIDKVGKVVNVSIVDSQPKRIFDKAAKLALRKWKYQAKSVDGQAVYQKNRTVQLDFTIEQQI